MKWYEKQYVIDEVLIYIIGSFKDSKIQISALLRVEEEPDPEFDIVTIYEKSINLWAHQEILAEDVLAKYEGMIRKCEKKLPFLVEKIKLNKRI